MLQVFYLDVEFSLRGLEYSMQHEIYVAAGFFLVIDGWIFFLNMFLMLQMLIFNVAYVSFLCCKL